MRTIKVLIATQNEHKLNEFKILFNQTPFELISLKSLNDNDDVEETANTFIGNALIKAKHYQKKYQMTVIAEDSGLSVDYLKGRPGVYSKRYYGSDHENNLKVLEELESIEHRNAHFTSAIVVCFNDGTYLTFKGEVFGRISKTYQPNPLAFGYDPIFIPDGYQKSFDDLGPQIKHQISHRAHALKALKEQINEIINHK